MNFEPQKASIRKALFREAKEGGVATGSKTFVSYFSSEEGILTGHKGVDYLGESDKNNDIEILRKLGSTSTAG